MCVCGGGGGGGGANKIVQEITPNVANVFSFNAIIAIEHGFSMH